MWFSSEGQEETLAGRVGMRLSLGIILVCWGLVFYWTWVPVTVPEEPLFLSNERTPSGDEVSFEDGLALGQDRVGSPDFSVYARILERQVIGDSLVGPDQETQKDDRPVSAVSPQPRKPDPRNVWRCVGLVADDRPVALFENRMTKTIRRVPEGEIWEDVRVETIEAGRVIGVYNDRRVIWEVGHD